MKKRKGKVSNSFFFGYVHENGVERGVLLVLFITGICVAGRVENGVISDF